MSKTINAVHNKNESTFEHSQSDATLNKTPKPHKNVSLVAETPAYEANEFPRAASNALLVEQNSDEDQPMDFSIEREILKKQLKKQHERNVDSNGLLKPCEIHHQNSNKSILDECEDCDEAEDQIVRALEEIDNPEKVD